MWTRAASPEPARRVAAATIAPLADVLARVAGPSWDVRTLVPPGTSPHVFEPTPREVRLAAPARLIVTVGAGYDRWAVKLAFACAPGAALFDAGAAAGVEEPSSASGREHEEEEADPHWWLDPGLVERALGPLAEKLAAADPAGAEGYRRRAAALAAELSGLDAEIAASLAPVRGGGILSAHNAWERFASRYGLRTVGSIEPVPGREPSPRDLAALVTRRAAKESGRSSRSRSSRSRRRASWRTKRGSGSRRPIRSAASRGARVTLS